MRKVSVVSFALLAGSTPAWADVPVADAARLDAEVKTKDCTTDINRTKQGMVEPTGGVKDSVTTPGQASAVNVVGSSSIDGIADFASLLGAGLSVYSVLRSGEASSASVARAISAVSSALRANQTALQGYGGQIGTQAGIQAGFDQNSGIRLGTARTWSQGVQTANTQLGIRQQQLLQRVQEAARGARVTTYDTKKARFVAIPGTASNVEKINTKKTTIKEIDSALAAAEAQPQGAIGSVGQ